MTVIFYAPLFHTFPDRCFSAFLKSLCSLAQDAIPLLSSYIIDLLCHLGPNTHSLPFHLNFWPYPE